MATLNKIEVEFRASMRSLVSNAVLVTTLHEGRPWALTISSCCSLTINPPQILISLRSTTISNISILESGLFGINILNAGQKAYADFGSVIGKAKFVEDFCQSNVSVNSPLIANSLYHIDCTVAAHHPIGDHSIIIGLVTRVTIPRVARIQDSGPLLFYNHAYWKIGHEVLE